MRRHRHGGRHHHMRRHGHATQVLRGRGLRIHLQFQLGHHLRAGPIKRKQHIPMFPPKTLEM